MRGLEPARQHYGVRMDCERRNAVNAKDRKAINAAALILREDASDLMDSHTIDGNWGDELEAMREYRLLRRLAMQLERIADAPAECHSDK